ncbi:MAG: hypothetical protein JO372_10475 [Solirubrobacterales bacterium]|nr:hypothetical protein [Solirubrobacterales bacterium]
MNQSQTATGAARRVGAGVGRIMRVWRVLPYERRLAALAAIGLFFTLFLPWYQETVIVKGRATSLQAASVSVTGWGAFSFVEAAVLLVAAGVLTLLFQRGEGHAFHLPGGDGAVITAAGVWTCVLVVWRIFDKQDATSSGQLTSTSGIDWGIFIALAVAAFLAYSGSRIRLAHRPEPPLPGEKAAEDPTPPPPSEMRPRGRRQRPARATQSAPRRGMAEAEPDGGWEMGPAWETSGAWEAAAARTEPLPGASGEAGAARTEPLPRSAAGEAQTDPLPGAAGEARTEPLPRPPGASDGARRARSGRRAQLADLPRPEPEDPPTLRIPSRSSRPTHSGAPDQPPAAPYDELTSPLEEIQTED